MVSVSPPPIESHAILRDRMLAHAQEMIERGDRLQASEKIWGAVAHAVKAVAEERGWPYSHHADGGVIVDYIAERVDDAEMAPLFDSIENLHRNFYEDTYSLPRIRRRLERAERLVAPCAAPKTRCRPIRLCPTTASTAGGSSVKPAAPRATDDNVSAAKR